ncbi:MAG: hypothetical protein II797_01210, partial [Clostridia bacterium]|nr:hypothetical protein [Clostridia bacterium]
MRDIEQVAEAAEETVLTESDLGAGLRRRHEGLLVTGDEYCDIVGSDTCGNSTHKQGFRKLEKITDKPLC